MLDRRPAPAPPAPGTARLLGEPRLYKGYARLFTCTAAGVGELTLQKRDDPALFKALKQGRTGLLHQWTITGDRITGTSPPA